MGSSDVSEFNPPNSLWLRLQSDLCPTEDRTQRWLWLGWVGFIQYVFLGGLVGVGGV